MQKTQQSMFQLKTQTMHTIRKFPLVHLSLHGSNANALSIVTRSGVGRVLTNLSSLSIHTSPNDDTFERESNPKRVSLKSTYLKYGKFDSLDALVGHLARQVIYQSEAQDPRGGVVAFNKPAGLPKEGPISVASIAQPLADILEWKQLIPVKCPDRYSSGVCLMATNEKSRDYSMKLLRGAKTSTLLTQNYHVLTHHFPRLDDQADLVEQSMTLIDNREAQIPGRKHCEPILSRNMTSLSRKKALQKKRIDPPEKIRVYVKCLAKSGYGPAALVSVQPSSVRSMFLRVYMNDLLAPILGDHTYSYRSRLVMGVMTKVSHKQSPPYNPIQNLPRWIMERTGLAKGEEGLIPAMVHLTRLTIPHYFKKNEHLMVFAPHPKFFSETAEALGITMKPQEWNEQDRPVYHNDEMRKRHNKI